MKEDISASNQSDWGTRSRDQEERVFLEGPKSRSFEIHHAFNVFFEILKGLRTFHFVGPCVTVFGSARFDSNHDFYKLPLNSLLLRCSHIAFHQGEPDWLKFLPE